MDSEEVFYIFILSAALLLISGIELFFLGIEIEYLLAIALALAVLIIGIHKRWKIMKENQGKKNELLIALFTLALFISQTTILLLLKAKTEPFLYIIFPFIALILILGYWQLSKTSKNWKKELAEKPKLSAICNELSLDEKGEVKESWGSRKSLKTPGMKLSKAVEIALASDKLIVAELPFFGRPKHSKYERSQIQEVELEELKYPAMLDRNWALKISASGKKRAFLTNENTAQKIREWWAKSPISSH